MKTSAKHFGQVVGP